MTSPIHIIDLAWAAVGLLALVYPLIRLADFWAKPSSHDVLWLIVILGTYPSLLAVYHLTPFDIGLVYATTVYIAPLFFFAMTRYLGYRIPYYKPVRTVLLAVTTVLALLALTNTWHQLFATFEPHTPGQPNHLLDDAQVGPGMFTLHAMAGVLVGMTVLIGMVQFGRGRRHWPQMIVGVVLPGLGLLTFTSTTRSSLLTDHHISGFILVTTAALLVYNYAIARRHFVDVRFVTRSRLMGLMPDAMVLLSANHRISDCNRAFSEIAGRPARSLIGQQIGAYLPALAEALDSSDAPDVIEMTDGEQPRCLSVTCQRVDASAGGNGEIMVLLRDISELMKAHRELAAREVELNAVNERLKALTVTEDLTGLKNRRFLQERLEQEFERLSRDGKHFGLLSIDLDHFKNVNDRHGHLVGDQALCHVARVMEAECRTIDTLARVGGEEFMVLLLDMDPQTVRDTAERFRRAIENNPMPLGDDRDKSMPLTASIGGVLSTSEDSMRSILARVDEALYHAKNAGRNSIEIR